MATPIRVLAFGDSLTEGLTEYNCSFHPYSTKLQELLQTLQPSQVVQSGVSGECVLETMVARLQCELQEAQAKGNRFHWVLILAGVNDVGSCATGEEVFPGLCSMYEAVGRHGARLLAMTCLENYGTGNQPADKERQRLNELIREYCMKHGGPGGAVLLDLDKLLPFVSVTAEERRETFDDGLHLTPTGYDRMAELIFVALKPEL